MDIAQFIRGFNRENADIWNPNNVTLQRMLREYGDEVIEEYLIDIGRPQPTGRRLSAVKLARLLTLLCQFAETSTDYYHDLIKDIASAGLRACGGDVHKFKSLMLEEEKDKS